jgi:hypothetical protein
MTNHEAAERAFVAVQLDRMAAVTDQARAAMADDLQRLTEEWRSTSHQELADHEARMNAMRDQTRQYLRDLTGDADVAAPVDVGQGQVGASAGAAPAASMPGPGQPDPRVAADLERAQEIKNMDFATYARLRAELGVESPTSMNYLIAREAR